jgi:hypothetical protein
VSVSFLGERAVVQEKEIAGNRRQNLDTDIRYCHDEEVNPERNINPLRQNEKRRRWKNGDFSAWVASTTTLESGYAERINRRRCPEHLFSSNLSLTMSAQLRGFEK